VSESAAAWQERLDAEYPRGALCYWDYGKHPDDMYRVPRILVDRLGENGLPVISLVSVEGSRELDYLQVASYTPDWRGTGMAHVTFANVKASMTWSNRVTDAMTRIMAPEREKMMQHQPESGQ
jgi:hypothetical protein